MKTRALLPGLLWSVRDTSPPTPRKLPKVDRRCNPEGVTKAGHVLWLHEQGGTYREIATLTGYGYPFVHGVLARGAYLRAEPTPWPPKQESRTLSTEAAADSAAKP